MRQHRDAAYRLTEHPVPEDLLDAALTTWDEVLALGEKAGFRNGQVSVLAPTGTIAFLMDCDTTGVEPDIALIKYKRLVGGGYLKIVNQTVPHALKRLGYSAKEAEEIVAFIDEHETIEGAPHLKAGAPAGLRLRLQAGQRQPLDPLQRPPQDDGRGAAVPVRRHQQDGQHAGGLDRRPRSRRSTSTAGSWASRPSRSTATTASARSR